MTVKKDPNCEACLGQGWLIATVSGSQRVPDGTLEIERCDECEVYKSDAGAAHNPQAQEALAAAQSGADAYDAYMLQLTGDQRYAPRTHTQKLLNAISEARRLRPSSIEFYEDWKQSWTKEEAEAEFLTEYGVEFEFTGPGWYLTKTDSMLVIPGPRKGQYWFLVYNGRNPVDAFNSIVNAPVRQDSR